ncbi:MAG: hypothetical protein M3Z04_23395 [Chloroflexota bacterium]|nr:hypothetical protein [Chloroflexota bacterium]
MRSADDEIAISVLSFLAATHNQVAVFWRSLREKAALVGGIKETVFDVECQRDANGPAIWVWVEGGVGNGESLTWWLDINCQEAGWLLSASIAWNGNDRVVKLPEYVVIDFPTVQQKTPQVLEELFNLGLPIFESAIEKAHMKQI